MCQLTQDECMQHTHVAWPRIISISSEQNDSCMALKESDDW